MAFFISMLRIVSILIILSLFGCKKAEVKEILEYKGPAQEFEKLEMFYSENDHVKTKLVADVFYVFLNEDREFPKGIYIEIYNEFGRLQSTLRANTAYFFKEENKWRARGKVEVKNIEKGEQLNTEELFWKPADQKIFTEKFVTIRQQGDVIYGTGLDAKQDLSDYTILKPYGEVEVKDE